MSDLADCLEKNNIVNSLSVAQFLIEEANDRGNN
jgi:hypothetical protein